MDTLSGPALAEALARVTGRPTRATRLVTNPMQIGAPLEFEPAAECETDAAIVTVSAAAFDGLWLRVQDRPSPGVGNHILASGHGSGATLDEAIKAARDDALSRLRAGYEAVRDVLDPWRDGPPDTDGWYEVECEYRVDEAPTEPGVWTDGMWLLPGDASGWPTVSGRPARYRALHLSAPPERGTDA